MARFILHIGQSKTGTTAIQHFLAENRSAMRNLGVLYPNIRNRGIFLDTTDHNLVAWSLIGKLSPIGVSFKSFLDDVKAELRKDTNLHTVILSAEAFLGEPHIWDFASEDAWRRANLEKIQILRHLLSEHEVTILVYLRRQDYWVNSAYNHIIKTEGLVGRQLYSNIQQFIEHLAPRLDYAQELKSWSDQFGYNALIVRPYERSQLVDGDAVSDFLFRVGLADDGSRFIRPRYQESRNLGLPRDVLEVKRILNRVPKSKPEERVLIWALQKIGSMIPSPYPQWDFLLTTNERLMLLERFDAANRLVAEHYVGLGQEKLFQDITPDHEGGVVDYPGLGVDSGVEIILLLKRVLQSWPARKLYYRYKTGDWLRRNLKFVYLFLLPSYRWCTRKLFNKDSYAS